MKELHNSSSKDIPWKVADLFSGCGGMSYGFFSHPQYFKIVAAVDCERGKPGLTNGKPACIRCNTTYEMNIGVRPMNEDLSIYSPEEFMRTTGIEKGQLTVLIACAPCTGFSQKNAKNHLEDDPRNFLVEKSGEFVEALMPEFLVMENVKELIKGKMSFHYDNLKRTLEGLGYTVKAEIHDFSEWGLPQRRIRALIVARRDGKPLPPFPEKTKEFVTVRDAISDLTPLEAGQIDPADPMHRCPGHNAHSMERIRAIPHDGGSWADIPQEKSHLLIPRMQRARAGSFPDIYGRLWWDRPAITITRECGHPGNGRYLHPEQDRMLSVREMAILQGFPRTYMFEGPMSAKYNQIGDAVPPVISRKIAEYIASVKTDPTLDCTVIKNEPAQPSTKQSPLFKQ
jgi:DNA (cytosine-5)-methyltransferase 1